MADRSSIAIVIEGWLIQLRRESFSDAYVVLILTQLFELCGQILDHVIEDNPNIAHAQEIIRQGGLKELFRSVIIVCVIVNVFFVFFLFFFNRFD
jgi:preprotein translocase subunit SecE